MSQINGYGKSLLLIKLLPKKLREKGNYPFIGEEEVIGAAELALGFKGAIIGSELGELEDFGDWNGFTFDLLLGGV